METDGMSGRWRRLRSAGMLIAGGPGWLSLNNNSRARRHMVSGLNMIVGTAAAG